MQKAQEQRKIYSLVSHESAANGPAEWASADGDRMVRAVERATARGGAIRFGMTRDGGAYAIGIYGDGDPYTLYIRPSEDINAVLDSISAGYESMDGPRDTTPQVPKRRR
jgi:hypothetical protein